MDITFNKYNSFLPYGPQWQYVTVYNEERTISKEFTIWKIWVTGFRIVEEHVVDCFEIGGHKTR